MADNNSNSSKPMLDAEIAQALADQGILSPEVAQGFVPNQSFAPEVSEIIEEPTERYFNSVTGLWEGGGENLETPTSINIPGGRLADPSGGKDIKLPTLQDKLIYDVKRNRAAKNEIESNPQRYPFGNLESDIHSETPSPMKDKAAIQYERDLKAVQDYNEQAQRVNLPLKPEPVATEYGLHNYETPEKTVEEQAKLDQEALQREQVKQNEMQEKEVRREQNALAIKTEAAKRQVKNEDELVKQTAEAAQKTEAEVKPQVEQISWLQPGSLGFVLAAAIAGGAAVASGAGGNPFLEAYQKRIDKEASDKKWTEEQKTAAEKMTLEKMEFALKAQVASVTNQKTLMEIQKLQADILKAKNEKTQSLASKENAKLSSKQYWEGKQASEKTNAVSAEYQNTLNSLRNYGKGSAGTGFAAGIKSLLGPLAPDTQALQNMFNSINLKNLVQTFQGFARSIDTDTERKAWDLTQPNLMNEDWVNASIIYNAQASLQAQRMEQEAKDQWYINNNEDMTQYKSPIAGKLNPMVGPDGESIILVTKDQLEQALDEGYLPPGAAAKKYFNGKEPNMKEIRKGLLKGGNEAPAQAGQLERVLPNGKVGIYDAQTKNFIKYK